MQKKLSKSNKIVILVCVAALICAVLIGSLLRNISANRTNITTTSVSYVTVRDSLAVKGLVLRSEKRISTPGEDPLLLCSDGERVAKGDEIAVSFRNASCKASYVQAIEQKEKCDMLRSILLSQSRESDLSTVNETLFEGLVGVSAFSEHGQINSVAETSIARSLLARAYVLDEQFDIRARISELEQTYQSLLNAAGSGSVAKASVAGYFSTAADGLEDTLAFSAADTLTTEDLLRYINASHEPTRSVGRIVTGYRWYFAAAIPESLGEDLRIGGSYTLSFSDFAVNGVLKRRGEPSNGSVLYLFLCEENIEQIAALRQYSAELVKGDVSGYQIPKAAIRVVDGKQGVFVIRGQRCVFMPVEILLDQETFYVVKADLSNNKGIYLNDTLVLSGKNLYDGMVIDS